MQLEITCLCGGAKGVVDLALPPQDGTSSNPLTALCNCDSCRHITGVLSVAYFPIFRPTSTTGLREYASSPRSRWYFCTTCGCHVFHALDEENGTKWELATGTVVSSGLTEENLPPLTDWTHDFVADTKDGGATVWLPGGAIPRPESSLNTIDNLMSSSLKTENVLPAACRCGTVRFDITRPDASSRLPTSNFPDLMLAYHSGDPAIKNPQGEKWWLRCGDTKYLAGTCACRSCRLSSGFEIQTWAFVPRSNIHFHIPPSSHSDATSVEALDFATLRPGILTSYESSPGVIREFCPGCGATVFWHDKWRPDLIDVSVGLLNAPEEARAEGWLDWWTDRVSFSEDAELGRTGMAAERAKLLIDMLAAGLRSPRSEPTV